jgi:hypothetical protein
MHTEGQTAGETRRQFLRRGTDALGAAAWATLAVSASTSPLDLCQKSKKGGKRMGAPSFTRVCIGELDNGAEMNTLFNVADLNRDGKMDIFSSGRNGIMVWFENKGGGKWERHLVDNVRHQECGGLAYDLDRDGWPDILNGSDSGADEIAWWRNPGPQGGRWKRHLICKTGANQFHDTLIADITNEGRPSLLFWNQGSGTLYWTPIPRDPSQSPWPNIQTIATGMREGGQPEEGLAVADIDGDGKNEIVAGTHWYRYLGWENRWERHKFARDYISTVIALGDINGDGRNEILLAEGDACIYGKPQGGKFAWFRPGQDIHALWEEHLIEDHLLDPHSLQLGDICGNGHLDILVGEIGVRDTYREKPPRLMVFENDGKGNFQKHIIDTGTGSHHAQLADFRNCGVLDIASRPLHGPDRTKIFVWYNDRCGKVWG